MFLANSTSLFLTQGAPGEYSPLLTSTLLSQGWPVVKSQGILGE